MDLIDLMDSMDSMDSMDLNDNFNYDDENYVTYTKKRSGRKLLNEENIDNNIYIDIYEIYDEIIHPIKLDPSNELFEYTKYITIKNFTKFILDNN
jgi:hypothetical protein